MFKRIKDKLFPRCYVYKWGRYVKTKRIFILKYLLNRR